MSDVALTLLGKPDCHLCHEMRAVVERAIEGRGLAVVDKDIGSDVDLDRRYRFEIPVLLLGDREIARHRVTEAELRERLAELGL